MPFPLVIQEKGDFRAIRLWNHPFLVCRSIITASYIPLILLALHQTEQNSSRHPETAVQLAMGVH